MNNENSHIPYLMTIKEAADYFGIGQKRLRTLYKNLGPVIGATRGNRVMIKRTALEEYIRNAETI